ncbi:protein phosphatase inhibitor 2-like isoform X2 [Cylas formicarius]|uniref:protein phosphatase inhibitor 2-like isoform X2 n=1 Tax=Cylas formicarius TaxID=197179 RepID=UPI002958C426|nr:protein phosphatase inhibitor 2-like isoform X2 [Cylas formicarius]
MSENLQKRPVKGILKNSSSFDKQDSQPSAKKSKETKWDEMNIIATLHPPGKDYGHMKIDEPKTPYSYDVDMDNIDGLDAKDLAEKIRIGADRPPKVLEPSFESSEDEEEEELTEEEKQRRREFELKRKKHYNEFHALQLAKKLLEEEEEDEDNEDTNENGSGNRCSGSCI